MAPPTRSRLLVKNAFAPTFSKQKTQTYSDSTRSSISHNIRTIAWNPLGTLIATGAGDRTLRIWNPEKANVKNSTELRGHQGSIDRVAWNPVREAELASCGADGTVRFWDVRSKASIGEVKVGGECFTLAWTPDGNEMLVGRKVSYVGSLRFDDSCLCKFIGRYAFSDQSINLDINLVTPPECSDKSNAVLLQWTGVISYDW